MPDATKGGIVIDKKSFVAAVERLGKSHNITAGKVMRSQQRLWGTDLVKMTPPKSMAQGRGKIKRDMHRVFVPIRDRAVLKIYADMKRSGILSQEVLVNEMGELGKARGYHKRFRTKRGSVRRPDMRTVLTIGDEEFLNGMYLPESKFNTLFRERSRNVGVTKAAWLGGGNIFRIKAPAWVAKHARKSGGAIDAMNDKTGSGFLQITNNIPWIRDVSQLVVAATAKRKRDITFHLKRAIERIINEENKKK